MTIQKNLLFVAIVFMFVSNNLFCAISESSLDVEPTKAAPSVDAKSNTSNHQATAPLKIYNMQLDNGMTIHGFHEGMMLSIYGEIFPGRVYEFTTSNPIPLIIDCGSNIGFSILYFKGLYPNATIYGFEPDPLAFSILQHNVSFNQLTDVHLFNVALDAKKGIGSLSIDAKHPASAGLHLMKNQNNPSTAVPIEQLSTYLQTLNRPIDLLKIDVEGAEHGIMEDLIEHNLFHLVQEMFIEYHHHSNEDSWHDSDRAGKFISILENQGFGYQFGMWNNGNYLSKGGNQSFMLHCYRKNKN